MFVSRYQTRSEGQEQEAALTWLHRQMAWERVLNRLREEAGVPAVSTRDDGAIPDRPAA